MSPIESLGQYIWGLRGRPLATPCASGLYCALAGSNPCDGVCTLIPALGEACPLPSACTVLGLECAVPCVGTAACDPTTRTCQPLHQQGEACRNTGVPVDMICAAGLYCVGFGQETCQPQLPDGAPCQKVWGNECAAPDLCLVAADASGEGKCTPITTVPVGGSCATPATACACNSVCDRSQGTCVPYPTAGMPCVNSVAGVPVDVWSSCLGGYCEATPDAATCRTNLAPGDACASDTPCGGWAKCGASTRTCVPSCFDP
jgi:hypothetical protein